MYRYQESCAIVDIVFYRASSGIGRDTTIRSRATPTEADTRQAGSSPARSIRTGWDRSPGTAYRPWPSSAADAATRKKTLDAFQVSRSLCPVQKRIGGDQ